MWYLYQSKVLLLLIGVTLCEVTDNHCGRRQDRRMKDEDDTSPTWPTLVSVRYDCRRTGDSRTHCCTGTILSESYIFTAAHCVEQFDHDGMTVVAGVDNRSVAEQVIRTVDRIIMQPNRTFARGRSREAVALLHLSSPLNFTDDGYIVPVCLTAPVTLEKDGIEDLLETVKQPWTISWNHGPTESDRQPSNIVQQVEIRLLDPNDSVCQPWIAESDQQCFITLHHPTTGSSLNHDLSKHSRVFFRFRCMRSYVQDLRCALVFLDRIYCLQLDQPGQPIFQWLDDRWMQVTKQSCAHTDASPVFARWASPVLLGDMAPKAV